MSIAFVKVHKYKILIGLALCCALLIGLIAQGWQVIDDDMVPLGAFGVLNPGDTVTVRVYAPQVVDLYGYQFNLDFDDNALEFVSVRSSLPEITLIFQRGFPGTLLVGATRIGNVPGVTASGENIRVSEVTFRATTRVAPDFSIRAVQTVDSNMESRFDIPGWRVALGINQS